MDEINGKFYALLNSDAPERESIAAALDIFSQEDAKQLAAAELSGDMAVQRGQLFSAAAEWLLAREEVPDELMDKFCDVGEFVCAAAENADGWIAVKKLRAQFLIKNNRWDDAQAHLDELKELLPNDTTRPPHTDSEKALSIETPAAVAAVNCPNICDKSFYSIIDRLRSATIEELLVDGVKSVSEHLSDNKEYYDILLKQYNNWYKVGAFNMKDAGFVKCFGYVYNYLLQNIDDLVWLYEEMCDYRSKYMLMIVIQHWLTFKPDIRKCGCEKTFAHYYDLDIIKCAADEVFVDCGAYNGDSILQFIEHYGSNYKCIYGYELTPSIYQKAMRTLKKYKRINLRNAGVSDTNGKLNFINTIDAGNRLMDGGNAIANVVRIDDDIKEDITFIKMDIEGAELAALHGAEGHIKRTKPKLAISLYHKHSDLTKIPQAIKRMVPEYKFYFQHCPGDWPFPTEYILFAV